MADKSGGGEHRPDEMPQDTGSARGRLRNARSKAGKTLATVRETGAAVIEDTREKGYRAAAETNRLFHEHPVAAVAAAAAVGAVIAIFAPKLVVASKAGAVAGKAGSMARAAARSPAAREAAQVMLAGLGRKDKERMRRAVGEAASSVRDRVKARRARRKAAKDSD